MNSTKGLHRENERLPDQSLFQLCALPKPETGHRTPGGLGSCLASSSDPKTDCDWRILCHCMQLLSCRGTGSFPCRSWWSGAATLCNDRALQGTSSPPCGGDAGCSLRVERSGSNSLLPNNVGGNGYLFSQGSF